MANGLETIVSISYDGSNTLIKQLVDDYNFVVSHKIESFRDVEEARVLAISASILYHLGSDRLYNDDKVSRFLGEKRLALNSSVDGAYEEIREAIKFFWQELLDRWYKALELRYQKGLSEGAIGLSNKLEDVKANIIHISILEYIEGMSRIMESIFEIQALTPPEGWVNFKARLRSMKAYGGGQYL